MSRTLISFFLVMGASVQAAPRSDEDGSAARCDRLAAYPGDHTSPMPAVPDADLRPRAAVAACEAALAEPGARVRHLFLLARGLIAAGEERSGVLALETAARRGHPAALFLLAELHLVGRGVAQDKVLAYALYQDAFRRGHAAGLAGMIAVLEDPSASLYDPEMAAKARAIDDRIRRR